MVLDTRREALDAQAVAHLVRLDGLRIEPATTPPTAGAARVDLSAGIAVISPRKGQVERQSNVNGGALAADHTMAMHIVVYFLPLLSSFLVAAVPGEAIDFTGAELPDYPSDDDVQAALPDGVEPDMWTLAGTVVVRNDGGVITMLLDESTRSYGVDPDGRLTPDLVSLTKSLAIADPGDAGAIPVTGNGVVLLTTGAGGETRTLAPPTFVGQRLSLVHDVDGGGAAVLTASIAINEAGNNTVTFDDPGEYLALEGVQIGGALVWRVIVANGAGLTTV